MGVPWDGDQSTINPIYILYSGYMVYIGPQVFLGGKIHMFSLPVPWQFMLLVYSSNPILRSSSHCWFYGVANET